MMKNYKLVFMFMLSASMVIMTGCGKDDDEAVTPPAATKTELLTAGPWRLTAFTVNPALDIDRDGIPETELLTLLPPCSRDDLTIFKADKTFTEEEGPTKCDPADPQVFTTGTWAFGANETQITYSPAGDTPYTVDLHELSATTLRTTTSFTDSATTYTFTSVYSH